MRKQQTKTSKKMQQQKELDRRQKEEDLRKQEEEEERRKREEEIRKIRDLSNQEEQYNRFMKLVGGKRRSRSRVRNFLRGVLVLHLGFINDLACFTWFCVTILSESPCFPHPWNNQNTAVKEKLSVLQCLQCFNPMLEKHSSWI